MSHDKYSTLASIFATQLSPRAVYFIQTGGSALLIIHRVFQLRLNG